MTRIIGLCAGSGMLAHAAAYALGVAADDTPILSIDIAPAALAKPRPASSTASTR